MSKFDGISFENKTIEDYLTDETTKEIAKVMGDQPHYLKKKGRGKYMDTKEKDGAVSVTPQSKINALNLSNNLVTAKTRADKVIMRLLAGQRLTSHAIVKYMGLRASDAASLLRLVWVSGLRPFCMREGDGGKGYFYSFKPAGVELKPELAIKFFKTPRPAPNSLQSKGVERSTPDKVLTPKGEEAAGIKHVLTPPVVDHNIHINVNVVFSFKWGD